MFFVNKRFVQMIDPKDIRYYTLGPKGDPEGDPEDSSLDIPPFVAKHSNPHPPKKRYGCFSSLSTALKQVCWLHEEYFFGWSKGFPIELVVHDDDGLPWDLVFSNEFQDSEVYKAFSDNALDRSNEFDECYKKYLDWPEEEDEDEESSVSDI